MSTVWRDRLVFIAPVAALFGLALITPSEDGLTICPFALCTGTACPGCGMTRAASTLIRGDLSGALTYHPLIPLILAQLVVGWFWFVLQRIGLVRPAGNRTITIALAVTALALVSVWVGRLLSGTLPPV